MDRRLVELCDAIATADAEGEDRYGAAARASGLGGQVLPARLAGFRAVNLTCHDDDGYPPNRHQPTDVPDRVDLDALDRAHGFALELIRSLDADLGRKRER